MSDLQLSVQISRALLGLSPLEINDFQTYYVAPEFLGSQVTFNRVNVTSPFDSNPTTVFRSKQKVEEPVTVEIKAKDTQSLVEAREALIQAFTQSTYTLTARFYGGSVVLTYACECANYQPVSSGPRWIAGQLQIAFTVPRQPVPLTGGI